MGANSLEDRAMRKHSIISLFLAVVVVASVVLGGCSARSTATPVPKVPTSTPPPTRVSPTETPTPKPSPTATPLPPGSPRLLDRSPERGEEQFVSAPLLLHFDQAMDRTSVEGAFKIEPAVEGSFSWDDPSTMRFSPADDGFQRDASYRVTVDTDAQSDLKKPLAQPVEFRFQTIGYLDVTQSCPLADSFDVPGDTTIRVAFNRPVVPLTSIEGQEDLPSPIEISPDVAGQGSWINTSIYAFEPSERLLPGTEYTVRVVAGLEDLTGGVLAQDYAWSFTTELPHVVEVLP